MFVTAVYGALDPQSGRFTYANAGHNPPMWIHAGQVDLLSRTGVAMGVVEHAQMTERSIEIAAGDLLMFYTDGITEAFSAEGEVYGEARLQQVLTTFGQEDVSQILDRLDTAVNKFVADYPVSDDITLIALKRLDGSA
jgi:sigma-B regulation protein RsbU (phosphoserine phosphatase)